VVGNHVDQQTHPKLTQLVGKALEIFRGAQRWAQAIEAAHVVSVCAFGRSSKERRCIDIRDAEFAQVLQDLPGLNERETAVEL
jgi:hypothetical protein